MAKPTTLKDETTTPTAPSPVYAQPDLLPTGADGMEKMQRLVIALNRVQGALSPAKKDASNPHFKAKYATLASVWDTARKALFDNGFALVQLPVPQDGGGVMLHTILYHRDGANIDMLYPVVYAPCPPQQLGSALKYARRYSFETIVGVTTNDDKEDDDGNTAPPPPPPQWKRSEPPAPAAQIQGTRPTLQDQATAYITKVKAADTWDEFMKVLADAGDLVERVRLADKSGNWITRINDVVREKRDTLEVTPPTAPQPETEPKNE